ncbi:amino acid adenylation domain-containing protein [Labilibaculum antarcticum]|uniref:AMP-dependent synthetase/ligase domain-containing protein n=1 Tax=Labilibaculum antarcticum TaxID=1717717 RepID=A0A1Y1CQA7_9BACT|nr:amino acid adenylation domain-containing protein [Labilibaculum antarcticum]BAX82626.1 hypothetical protein ALGA_4336 [Labilibaculum antarcticum]
MRIHVMEYLENSFSKYKEKVAVVDGDRRINFGDLRSSSLTILQYLVNSQLATNSPIAVYLPKSVESIFCYCGISYSGNFYVPLDIKSPQERMAIIVDSLSPKLILTNRKLKNNLLKIGYPLELIIEIEDILKHEEGIEKEFNLPSDHIDTNPAYILYTSGSTGIPKGVIVPHRAVIDYIDWVIEQFSIDDTSIIGNQAPFFFDQSVFDLFLMMATGSTIVLIPESFFIFPAKLLKYLNEEKINLFFWVPSLLVNIANFKLLDQIEMPYLKKVFFGGEVMSTRHLNYWRQKLPDLMYVNMYGPTEITVDCTYYIVNREISDDESVPIGFPCRNSGVLILNDNNQLTKVGELGELCVRGSSLALGYYNNKEKTDEVFVQNPLNKNYPEKIYRTGDVVYRNEINEIIYVCRKDFQIQHLGHRIELGEVEVAVMGLDVIENACVLYNSVKKEITLFFISDQKVAVRDLRLALSQKLSKYMIPTVCIQLEEMPLTSNGKINRNAIKQQLMR